MNTFNINIKCVKSFVSLSVDVASHHSTRNFRNSVSNFNINRDRVESCSQSKLKVTVKKLR